jgi:hypothetical protein
VASSRRIVRRASASFTPPSVSLTPPHRVRALCRLARRPILQTPRTACRHAQWPRKMGLRAQHGHLVQPGQRRGRQRQRRRLARKRDEQSAARATQPAVGSRRHVAGVAAAHARRNNGSHKSRWDDGANRPAALLPVVAGAVSRARRGSPASCARAVGLAGRQGRAGWDSHQSRGRGD